MESIYCLKAGDLKRAQTLMNEQAEVLFSRGAQIIVLGCTEVPVILADAVRKYPDKYIDSTGSLVRAGIKWYENELANIIFWRNNSRHQINKALNNHLF